MAGHIVGFFQRGFKMVEDISASFSRWTLAVISETDAPGRIEPRERASGRTKRFRNPRLPVALIGCALLIGAGGSAPAQPRQDAAAQVRGHALRVSAATPNVEGYYIVRQDIFDHLRGWIESSGAFGPYPLTTVLRLKTGARYFIFARCNGHPNMGGGVLIRSNLSEVILRCP
jgi:hypothetical protein